MYLLNFTLYELNLFMLNFDKYFAQKTHYTLYFNFSIIYKEKSFDMLLSIFLKKLEDNLVIQHQSMHGLFSFPQILHVAFLVSFSFTALFSHLQSQYLLHRFSWIPKHYSDSFPIIASGITWVSFVCYSIFRRLSLQKLNISASTCGNSKVRFWDFGWPTFKP